MKALESEHLSLARDALLKAAPRAAQTVISGLDDDCSKEQLSAAQDILDRVGVRKDLAPAQAAGSSEGIAIAYGAFRALFDAFGITVNLPEVPSFPSIDSEVIDIEPVPIEQEQAVATAITGSSSASRKKKQRPLISQTEGVHSTLKGTGKSTGKGKNKGTAEEQAEKEFEIEL